MQLPGLSQDEPYREIILTRKEGINLYLIMTIDQTSLLGREHYGRGNIVHVPWSGRTLASGPPSRDCYRIDDDSDVNILLET